MRKATPEKINERAQQLLRVLVDRYIRDGLPVGSRTLSRELDRSLSPASIRNIMADLEEMGLIFAPHTSAGRVPTARGYRLFVDTLLQVKPLSSEEEHQLRTLFTRRYNEHKVFEQTSNLLSEVTHLASVVMLPHRDKKALRHVEFLSLSGKRVLAILVFNESEVQNRIIKTSRRYTATELETTANYLNAAFAGKDVHQVRQDLLQDMRQTQQDIDRVMQTAIEVAEKIFEEEEVSDTREVVVAGQTNLMNVTDLSNLDKLRHLFVAFNQKHDILQLLDQALTAQGVKIFIGEESGYAVLEECSVIASPYTDAKGEVIGVLGVIGPTRMAYERVIPIVDLTAKLLGLALTEEGGG